MQGSIVRSAIVVLLLATGLYAAGDEPKRVGPRRAGTPLLPTPVGAKGRLPVQQTPRHTRVFSLQNARAEELASLIQRIVGDSIQIVADSRTNSLVVSSTIEANLRVQELVEILDSGKRSEAPKRDFQVIPLKHRSPSDAISMCQALFLNTGRSTFMAVADEPSNSIMVMGTAEDIEHLHRFLTAYDVPADGAEGAETVLLQPTYRQATKLLDLLRPVSSRAASISIDAERQTILVHGPASEVKAVSDVFARLDQPQPSLRLSFYFIKSGGPVVHTVEVSKDAKKGRGSGEKAAGMALKGGNTEKGQVKVGVYSTSNIRGGTLFAKPLPKNLEPVAAELADKGFEQAALLAAVVVRTEASAEFNTSGALAGSAGVGLNVSGRASLEKDEKLAHLQIEANVTGEKLRVPKGQRFVLFEVETVVTAPLGDYVILASAPSGAGTGESIAVVLRAEAD